MPDDAEASGLLALMLLHDARRTARVDSSGNWIPLDAQDSRLWDEEKLNEGIAALQRGLRLRRPGPYQLQAAITALHVQAADVGHTHWAQIAALYGALAAIAPSPVVTVNRAAAVAFASGPQAGLDLIEPLLDDPALEHYQPLHATHAELLRRAGKRDQAASAYERAIALTANQVERTELERRRQTL
jgi:RNA polymerase sigma-70 factor, ECF subfamily